MNNPIIKTLLITAFSKLIGDMTDLIGLLYKNETCPVRVDCNAHSVFIVTIGRQNYPSSWDGVRTESSGNRHQIHLGTIHESPVQVGVPSRTQRNIQTARSCNTQVYNARQFRQ